MPAPVTGARRPTFPAALIAAVAVVLVGVVPAAAQPEEVDGAPAPSLAPSSGSDEGTEATPAPSEPRETPRKKKERRGGINPCMTPDPGFRKYDGWIGLPSGGQMIAPERGGVTKTGGFDLVVHFHGHEPIRKEFVKTASGPVLVGIDLGIGSGVYQAAFSAPTAFTTLLANVEAVMSRRIGKPAHVRHIALSSWSAGYGAIEQILRQSAGKRVDALVLLDSVHAGYADDSQTTLKAVQLEPFVDFARRAAAKNTLMFLSHSSIVPPGYASTTETAEYLVGRLRGRLRRARRQDVLGLDLIDRFDRGALHVRGYSGDDKPDHCAHLGLMADVMRVHLQPRWKTPRAR